MNRRKVDVGISAVLLIVSLVILTNNNLVEGGMETDLGSMFLPRLVAVFIMLFSGTIGIQSIIKLYKKTGLGEVEVIDTNGLMGVAVYVVIFIFYWWLVPLVGFLVATPFAMFSIALLLGGRSWVTMSAISVITPIIVFYGCREYLRVYLPVWSLS